MADDTQIYLDYNASTPIAPTVAVAMRALLTNHYGNPSSDHWAGHPAREVVERSRRQIATLLGCAPDEVLLTSGGSEANNHVIKGVVFGATTPPHLITTAVEHPAILEPCRFVQQHGARVTLVPVDRHGLVDPDAVRRAITPETTLISVMHANNEVGTIQPIRAVADVAHEHGLLFHSDAAQSVGKVSTRVDDLGVDLLSLAGHKLYAPKGIGALFIRRGLGLTPLIHGGGHERGQRAGTESALLAAGLGAACELATDDPCGERLLSLRERFWTGLHATLGDRVQLNGHPTERLPNTLSLAFPGHRGDDLLTQLPRIAASTGSACHTGEPTLSPVLAAMGIPTDRGLATIRFSLGRDTTEQDVDRAVDQVRGCL
ncbi:MAG: cysteine desulfurase family protein [Acidobacteriota bacterium]|nr:cysteine desulfurase family protein [Acidobacteriota bacterium]